MSPIFQLLSVLMLADLIPGSKASVLEEALNRNLLATFLLVNKISFSYIHIPFLSRFQS